MRLLLPLLLGAACAYPCSEVFTLEKDAALVKVREDPPDLSEECVSSLMSQGHWEAALIVASKAVEAEIALSEDLRAKVFAAHSEVTKLLHAFDSRPQLPVLTPALYWAQSKTHAYVDVKFSHVAADSEPCLKLEDLKVEIETERLKLSGICGTRGHRIKYLLNIPLTGLVKADKSTYQVFTGHAEITLVKEAAGIWPELSEKKPGVVEKWWRRQRLLDTLKDL